MIFCRGATWSIDLGSYFCRADNFPKLSMTVDSKFAMWKVKRWERQAVRAVVNQLNVGITLKLQPIRKPHHSSWIVSQP